jgi:hypothetical protein
VDATGAAGAVVPVQGELASGGAAADTNPIVVAGARAVNSNILTLTVEAMSNLVGASSGGAAGIATSALNSTYDGASWQEQRGNQNVTLLASAVRAASTQSADQTNHNSRGVQLVLNVTANPGAAETLTIKLQGKDSISNTYYEICTSGVVVTATNAIRILHAYPGITAGDYTATTNVGKNVVLPRTWRAEVTHSASGNWTYSLSAVVLV